MSRQRIGLGRRPQPAPALSICAVLLLLFVQCVFATPPSGQETVTVTPPSDASTPPGPARHLSTVVDPDTGLITDTYVKPLGTTTPGEVRFTRPSAEVLERPSPNASIVIVNINFDLVDPETLTPYPLDRIYNHHLVIHGWETGDTTDGDARTEIREAISEILPGAVELATAAGLLSSDAATSTGIAAAMRGTLGAAIRRRRGHSSLLTPCGVGVGVAGAGAEWRGQQLNVSRTYKDDPFLNGSRLWVEPGNTTWGVNAHLIDLRDVENLADAVQCNCAAYAKRTPGTPQNWDHGPLPGGTIACCGDGALGPLVPGSDASMDPGTFGASVGILYNVTWFPNTPEALQKVPEGIQKLAAKAPMQTTLMVSSNPLVDGAACGGEYNARACAASSLAATPEAEERLWREERFRLGDRATAPGNQTCDEKSVVAGDEDAKVSVSWSHLFRLPKDVSYDVTWLMGHQHVGGRSIQFINVTDTNAPNVLCDSRPTYGSTPGAVGDEAGFIVNIEGCRFDPPVRLTGGETYVIRSEYGADAENYAPAAFLGLEGVMGYMIMRYTVPTESKVGVFSMSGERTVEGDLRRALTSKGGGLCVASVGDIVVAGGPTAAPDPIATNGEGVVTDAETTEEIEETEDAEETEPWSSVLLSAEDNFTMSWRFTDDTYSSIEFKLSMDRPTWMSIAIHKPGGHGMVEGDYLVVQSMDDGDNFLVQEMYTEAYDRPRSKTFYGLAATTRALSSGDCAVEVSPEGIEAVFVRTAAAAPDDDMGVDITRGVPTTVVWAHGHEGFAMDYHSRHRGTVSVTW